MSTSNVTFNTKEKKPGHVAADILSRLQEYKEQELSPKSTCLRDKLLETANKVVNDNDDADVDFLEIAFEAFEETQKQEKTMSEKIESLEAQLQASKSQYNDEKVKYVEAKAELDEMQFLTRYGDWFAADKIDAKAQAAIDIMWPAMNGRHNTETDQRVEAEKAKIAEWQAAGEVEEDAPATPFLDRIQTLCNISGIARSDLFTWIKEYGKRCEKCHHSPPVLRDHWKVTQNSEGEDVKVILQENNAADGIEWSTFWASFEPWRQDIESRHAAGQIDAERRNLYMGIIEAYYALYTVAEDEAGNPILTKYAKDRAKDLFDKQQKVAEPSENAEKNFTVGKWDDI